MKKKSISFTLLLLFSLKGISQPFCGQHIATENYLAKHPELRKIEAYNTLKMQVAESGLIQNKSAALSIPAYTIPVVFHILHTGGPENITDAQVIDQIALLNRDYQKKNADTINVVSSYTNNIANVGIAFQLATIDPDGNCTNGIIRHYTSNTIWDANDFSLFTYTWPRDKYVNIYVVRSINIAPAYSFLPSVPVIDSADVIVAQHNTIGSIGTSNVSNSRVITHEMGHWLNLLHIWGGSNSAGVVCGDDGVSDTPITKGFMTCSPANAAICTPPIPENYQNYMDYTPCKIMFTTGQATRMLNCLNGTQNNRNNLFSPTNLLATGITGSVGHCIPLVEIAPVESKTLCAGKSITIKSFTCNANASSYAWTTSGNAVLSATNTSSVSVTPSIAGNYTIICTASAAGGASSSSIVITAIPNIAYAPGNYFESFEGPGLPSNWQFLDPIVSSSSYWSVTMDGSSEGLNSAFVNGENAVGAAVEILETPSYNFLNNPGAVYTFKYAYAKKTATWNDLLKVQGSKDCGGTWKDIVTFNSSQMSLGSGGVSNSIFMPGPEHWKTYILSDHPNFYEYSLADNVKFRFTFVEDSTGNGNRLYLDEINLDSPVGLNSYEREIDVQVSPNPAQEHVLVRFKLPESKKISLSLTDITGKQITRKEMENEVAGNHSIEVRGLENYPRGLYFLNVVVDNFTITRKIVLS